MSKAGYLYDSSIVPVIGNDPFATGDSSSVCRLMTAAEGMQAMNTFYSFHNNIKRSFSYFQQPNDPLISGIIFDQSFPHIYDWEF
jgi:hypothetical protein